MARHGQNDEPILPLLVPGAREGHGFSLVEPERSEATAKAGLHAFPQGFSLVELAIVLVILGLLTGGILAGQSLIRAAELRAVSTEYARYIAATQTFRDKYFALPGDMSNATAFWGASTSNGDSDGTIEGAAAASVTGEMFQYWNQLALAGLIEGTYTGLAGTIGGIDTVPGTNSPKSKLNNAGWGVRYVSSYGGDAYFYAIDLQNYLSLGAIYTGYNPASPILKPEEAWNLDTKMDDGKPGTGKIVAASLSAIWGNSASCTTSTTFSDHSGNYRLSNSSLACALFFIKQF